LKTCSSSRWILRRMRNASDKSCRETHKTHSVTFFQKSCRLGDKVEKYCRAELATDDSIIRRMHFACWIAKDTDTHSEYVILTTVIRRQCLLERASVLLYTYVSCLVTLTLLNFEVYHKNMILHCAMLKIKLFTLLGCMWLV